MLANELDLLPALSGDGACGSDSEASTQSEQKSAVLIYAVYI